MTKHESDWSFDETGDDVDIEYDRYDKIVGGIARRSLDALSRDLTSLESDEWGWTSADYRGLHGVYEVDWLGRLLVPPSTTPLVNRIRFNDHMASLRAAIPVSEAERKWLFDGSDDRQLGQYRGLSDPHSLEIARDSEASLVSAGVIRVVHGRDLLQRWWSWRRETGEYADQGSLDQARSALKGVIGLLAPELGLPEALVELRASEAQAPEAASA
jgi:hypothetical protein